MIARRLLHASSASAQTQTTPTDPSSVPAGSVTARDRRYHVALAGLLVLVLAFYLWTAASSIPFTFTSTDTDVYNELTTGFLHGHTYLPITPPAGLLHLANPYDPVQNAPYNSAYHDLSLWKGHFYSQWGPTPVLTLFAPFRLTGERMPQSLAVALFAFAGLVGAVILLHTLVARLVPRTPRWALFVASFGLALTNTLPFLLRRPLHYEVAISCGYCFAMAGLALVVSSVLGPQVRRYRMLWGSLCLGLAVGGRPTLALGGAVALTAALWAIRRRDQRHSLLLYALGPFALCGVLLALYNHVRFGGFTNFGEHYELAGVDQTKAHFYRFAYIPPGLISYLLIPARLALTFPHAFLRDATADPFGLPPGYAGTLPTVGAEPAGGVLTTMPITLLLLGLPVLWWQRRSAERRALFAAGGLALLGLAIVILVSWALFGTTQRYEVDFASLFLIPAFLVWALLLARWKPGSFGRRAWAGVGVVFTLFGAAVGTATSFIGYGNLLQINHPAVFNALEDVTAPLATVATVIGGQPQLARVDNGPLPVTLPHQGYSSFTDAGASAWLGSEPITLSVLSPGAERLHVTADVIPAPGAPPLSKLRIQVRSGAGQTHTAAVLAPLVRLPISVHWGLTRIRLTIAGRPTSPQEYVLSKLALSP